MMEVVAEVNHRVEAVEVAAGTQLVVLAAVVEDFH